MGTSTPGSARGDGNTLPKGKLQHHSLSRDTAAARWLSWSHISPCHQPCLGGKKEDALGERARQPNSPATSAYFWVVLKATAVMLMVLLGHL